MSTLSQIVAAEKAITQFLETDEFPAEFVEMDLIRKELPSKVDGYKAVLDKLKLEEKYFKSQADVFITTAKRLKQLRDNLNIRLKDAMTHLDVNEIKGKNFRFKLSPVKPKVLVDLENLDAKYLKEVVEYKADNSLIRESIESGEVVQGAELEYGSALRVYVNREEK